MDGLVVRVGREPVQAAMKRSDDLRRVIELARDGDVDAFAVLVDRYGPQLHRLAGAIVGPDEAADATQEALLSAWRQLPGLRDTDRFEPWLRRILVNRCRNLLRGRGRRLVTTGLDVARGHDPADPAPPVDARITAQSALDAVFEQLTPDERALLSLHYTMDLSIRQSAAALGMATGTAKSRLNRALAGLRAALDPGSEA
jgi:RNA polymerase sigma-70 factor (ECF subfamily)